MARVDYEAAWHALQAEIADEEHPQRGQRWLLRRMAELQSEHVVPESLIERAARIYGVPRLVHAIPEADASAQPDAVRAGTPHGLGPPMTEGGHDGTENNGRAAA